SPSCIESSRNRHARRSLPLSWHLLCFFFQAEDGIRDYNLSAMTRVGKSWLEHGNDFASTIGTGGVVGTKFVWPDPGPKFKNVLLTQNKEAHWKKWIGIYNEKMLSKGNFRNLYVDGYDTPEGYAIE